MAYDTDIIISGGGLAGLSLALAVARPGLHVTVLEPTPPPAQMDASFDGRTVALAYAAQQMFIRLGLWEMLRADAGAILDIRIVDANSPLWLHYNHRDVGDHPMGYIVENRHLRRALFTAMENNPHITLRAPAAYTGHAADSTGITAMLTDGSSLRAKLLVAADGKASAVRQQAGITVRQMNYGQTAIVCTVRHEHPHHGVAIERFLPAGPFAILPMGMIDGETGHHSSLVWTEKDTLAPHYMAMDAATFHTAVAHRFGDHLGALDVVGGRWSYPLGLTMAEHYTAPRIALIGDAAHGIHPIAGQGLNLGLRDVAALAECILATHEHGLDIGGSLTLDAYTRARRADSAMMIAATDGLNRLFSNNHMPSRLARRLGLATVEKLPPLKHAFMRHAMGIRRNQASLMEPVE